MKWCYRDCRLGLSADLAGIQDIQSHLIYIPLPHYRSLTSTNATTINLLCIISIKWG